MFVVLWIIISIIALCWAANHLISGAIGIAHYYHASPLIIGLTIVAIGTSMPDIMVGINAAMSGYNDITLGNAIGSNIANIGLVLGIIILIRPLVVHSAIIRKEYTLLYLVMLFTYAFMLDGNLGVMDGAFFLLSAIAIIGYFIYLSRNSSIDPYAKEMKKMIRINRNIRMHCIRLAIGLIILPLSTHYLVVNAAKLAVLLGINQLVVGLTVVALGTSLPQAATSALAAYKGHDDIAIGNILGSNMFNLLLVLAFPAILNPSPISHALLWRDIPIMLGITLFLIIVNLGYKKKVARWHGGILLIIYFSYIISLITSAYH